MLTELLAVLVVSLLILGATVETFSGFLRQHTRTDRQTRAQDAARTAIDRMVHRLRSAMSAGGSGNQPIQQASDFNLVYLAPTTSANLTNNPRGLSYVRYCLGASDQTLYRQASSYDSVNQPNPPSTASCPDPAWTSRDVIANNVVNRLQSPVKPLFTPVTDASGAITDVRVHAVVDIDVAEAPAATDLRSSVTLRNLNHTPAAAVSCQKQPNSRVSCDASASSDPDGQTLYYSWKMNGGALSETSYRLDQPSVPNGTHTFQVTVTDSAGLSASASQQVTLP